MAPAWLGAVVVAHGQATLKGMSCEAVGRIETLEIAADDKPTGTEGGKGEDVIRCLDLPCVNRAFLGRFIDDLGHGAQPLGRWQYCVIVIVVAVVVIAVVVIYEVVGGGVSVGGTLALETDEI